MIAGSVSIDCLARAVLFRIIVVLSLGVNSFAQTEQPTQDQVPVLETGTRLVVEDVIVTNGTGEPIRGISPSRFHIFDQGAPQTIKEFEEGTTVPALSQAPHLSPGSFSNSSYLYSASLVSNVFLIDADTIPEEAQMFLLQQLRKAIDTLTPGVQVSIFCEASGHIFQVRSFTSEPDELKTGANECIPRLPNKGYDTFTSGLQQLSSVAATLRPLPGRKSILWFSGPFPLVPLADDENEKRDSGAAYIARVEAFRQMENMLSKARISVFPIDPRGVLISPDWNERIQEQYGYMALLASATGGTSSHLNDLEQQIDKALIAGRDGYTIAYAPAGYRADNSWHSIRVEVDGPYRISYRKGYTASPTNAVLRVERRPIEASDETSPGSNSASSEDPLLFTVQKTKTQGTEKRATRESNEARLIQIAIQVPVSQLRFRHEGTKWSAKAIIATFAYDDLGKLRGGKQQEVSSVLSDDQWQTAKNSIVSTQQIFSVPKSAKTVLFVVDDKLSRRHGTLVVPLEALSANQLPPQ